jgi:hypothetical protein
MKIATQSGRRRSAYRLLAGFGIVCASQRMEAIFENRAFQIAFRIGLCLAGLTLILTLLRSGAKNLEEMEARDVFRTLLF